MEKYLKRMKRMEDGGWRMEKYLKRMKRMEDGEVPQNEQHAL